MRCPRQRQTKPRKRQKQNSKFKIKEQNKNPDLTNESFPSNSQNRIKGLNQILKDRTVKQKRNKKITSWIGMTTCSVWLALPPCSWAWFEEFVSLCSIITTQLLQLTPGSSKPQELQKETNPETGKRRKGRTLMLYFFLEMGDWRWWRGFMSVLWYLWLSGLRFMIYFLIYGKRRWGGLAYRPRHSPQSALSHTHWLLSLLGPFLG